MFKRRTLFVVGAGASKEFDLPLGSELAVKISKKLDIRYDNFGRELAGGDAELWQYFHYEKGAEIREYQGAAWLIRDGVLLSNSIDDFLDIHSANQRAMLLGRATIVRAILEAERASKKLFFKREHAHSTMSFIHAEGTWLIKLMRMLSRSSRRDSPEEIFKNVAFIVFNYDRCIEHFFFHALKQLYQLSDQRAADIMSSLRILHPYGTVADLPYQSTSGIEFGGSGEKLTAPYVQLASRIRTYTEQTEDTETISAIKGEVETAEKIVFLGFAFHDQNMALLKPASGTKRKFIYGSATGMSASDILVVKDQLRTFFSDREREVMENKIFLDSSHKCADVFDHYTKSLPV